MNKQEFCPRGTTFMNTLRRKHWTSSSRWMFGLREDYLRLRLKWTEEVGKEWNSDDALNETNQQLEPQRLEFFQANQWADQAQRENSRLFGELSTKNRIYKQNRATDCQEIEALRRICGKRVRQLRIDGLSMQQEETPSTVNQLLSKFRNYRTRWIPSTDEKELILWSWDSEQLWNVTHSQSTLRIQSLGGMISRDSCLPHNTRNSMGTPRNVFEDPPAQGGRSSAFFENPSWLASFSCGLGSGSTGNTVKHEEGVRREPQSSVKPTLRFSRNFENLGTFLSYWRNLFSKLYDGSSEVFYLWIAFRKVPGLEWLSMWRVNFRAAVCANTPFHQLTKSWIKEVEMAKSIDDLMTSQSTEGKHFPGMEMLDAKIASTLRKIISPIPKGESVLKSSDAQKHDPLKKGRQNCLHDPWPLSSNWSFYDVAQGLSDMLNICLHGDDDQDFGTRWDQVLIGNKREYLMRMSWKICTRWGYKVLKKLQTSLAMYNQELSRNGVSPSYQRLRTMVRQHIGQMIGTRNFQAQNGRIETGVVVKSHKGRKSALREKKQENAVSGRQLDSVRKETLAVSTTGSLVGNKTIILFYFESADTDWRKKAF